MSSLDHKAQAQRLADHLSRVHGVKLKRASALEAVAALYGAADWNTLRARPSAQPDTAPPAEASSAGGGMAGLVEHIKNSIASGGPLVFGNAEEDRIARKQLLRIVHDFPLVSEVWHKYAMPSKAAPRCFCCQRTIYEAPVSVTHPELRGVHVCVECVPNPPPERAFGVWLIDDGDYVAADTVEEALAWYDAVHGPSGVPEGRSVEPRPLTEAIHTTEDATGPTKPLRQLVTERLRSGGTLPAVVAHDRSVL